MSLPPFPGFRPEAYQFLQDLKQNNDRAWFKPRKAIYDDELKWPLQCLVADVTRQAPAHGFMLTGDPKKSLFRIYRDTRFSKNKAPYKTHVSAVLSRSGKKGDPGALYVHIEPDNTFFAAGYWQPGSPLLRAWRTRMADDPNGFLSLADQLEQTGLPLEQHGDGLKRMPRGFEAHADGPVADYLRRKSFITVRKMKDQQAQSPDFTTLVLDFVRDTYPLLTYGWEIVDGA